MLKAAFDTFAAAVEAGEATVSMAQAAQGGRDAQERCLMFWRDGVARFAQGEGGP